MNLDRMINMLLINLSKKYKIFYMEKRSYKGDKTYKSFYVKIGKISEEFMNKRDMLKYLSGFKEEI